ncbi:MAG TPA: hypothetical protein VFX50_07395 [Gemmatimonadales bacterium]|nr:hypothetical protein [Gemmatimonadales bacterium]
MATTRICYKNSLGQVICYDSGASAMMLSSSDTSGAKATAGTGAPAAGSRPAKAAAMAQIVQVLTDAIAASGDRQMHGHPEFISIEYYAD